MSKVFLAVLFLSNWNIFSNTVPDLKNGNGWNFTSSLKECVRYRISYGQGTNLELMFSCDRYQLLIDGQPMVKADVVFVADGLGDREEIAILFSNVHNRYYRAAIKVEGQWFIGKEIGLKDGPAMGAMPNFSGPVYKDDKLQAITMALETLDGLKSRVVYLNR